MKKYLITFTLLLAFAGSSFSATNSFFGLPEGTAWESFADQLHKSTTKKDSFLDGLGGVRHRQISLTAAQINGMYAAPTKLLDAPATDKTIAIVKLSFRITRTATAFASGGAVIVQYDNTANGGGQQACDSTLASTVITGSAGVSNNFRDGAVLSDVGNQAIVNKGIYLSNATGAFTTGTGTAVVDIWFTVNP